MVVGVGVGVGVGVELVTAPRVFQKPPFILNVPPLIVFDAPTSPTVPSTLILPLALALVPPPPAITWRSIEPIACGVTDCGDCD
jgi:hypothetical protein